MILANLVQVAVLRARAIQAQVIRVVAIPVHPAQAAVIPVRIAQNNKKNSNIRNLTYIFGKAGRNSRPFAVLSAN
ncbi:MAG: hypothetical protein ACI4LO_01500, partial [Anaerovoracaceae bacterium]